MMLVIFLINFLKKNNYYSIKTTRAKKMTIIVRNAQYIFPGKYLDVNDEEDIKKYIKIVLISAGLPQDTLFDINNPEIIKLFNKKKNSDSDSFDFTHLIIDDNKYQILIFSPSYGGPSPKMLFSLYDVNENKYAILYRSN